MSELTQSNDLRPAIHRQLLTSVSVLALTACVVCANAAEADDATRPTVWIELGGQAEQVTGAPELFSPPFFDLASKDDLTLLKMARRFPSFSTGFEGKVTFAPEQSDWRFSVGIRYGKSGNNRHLHHQTDGIPPFYGTFLGKKQAITFQRAIYADTHSSTRESHAVLDFEVGKDVGLGLFGERGDSVVSLGVRFVQFTNSSHANLYAQPTAILGPLGGIPGFYSLPQYQIFANYSGTISSSRNTRAAGPSLNWTGSVPVVGRESDISLDIDWGVNAAVLFGRQKAHVRHQTHGYHYSEQGILYPHYNRASYTHGPYETDRSNRVTIPNIGVFGGLSLKFPNAKVSVGYRYDAFLNAMDTGIDTHQSSTLSFHGPFASISVGLGG